MEEVHLKSKEGLDIDDASLPFRGQIVKMAIESCSMRRKILDGRRGQKIADQTQSKILRRARHTISACRRVQLGMRNHGTVRQSQFLFFLPISGFNLIPNLAFLEKLKSMELIAPPPTSSSENKIIKIFSIQSFRLPPHPFYHSYMRIVNCLVAINQKCNNQQGITQRDVSTV